MINLIQFRARTLPHFKKFLISLFALQEIKGGGMVKDGSGM